ncbi:uncharacterized protein LOC144146581 [Haemaphysalis longicornis]
MEKGNSSAGEGMPLPHEQYEPPQEVKIPKGPPATGLLGEGEMDENDVTYPSFVTVDGNERITISAYRRSAPIDRILVSVSAWATTPPDHRHVVVPCPFALDGDPAGGLGVLPAGAVAEDGDAAAPAAPRPREQPGPASSSSFGAAGGSPPSEFLSNFFSDDEAADAQVNCWNEANGCCTTTAASDITRTFGTSACTLRWPVPSARELCTCVTRVCTSELTTLSWSPGRSRVWNIRWSPGLAILRWSPNMDVAARPPRIEACSSPACPDRLPNAGTGRPPVSGVLGRGPCGSGPYHNEPIIWPLPSGGDLVNGGRPEAQARSSPGQAQA